MAAPPTSTPCTTRPSLADRSKVRALVGMRRMHRRVLEQSSASTFRRRVVPTAPAPRVVPAARKYRRIGWLPADLLAAEKLPREAHLPLAYRGPYYGVGKVGWKLYGRHPIDPDLAWDPDSKWNHVFPSRAPGWGPPTDDETFVLLRLQGPNPFMLRKVDPDPERSDRTDTSHFDVDFSALFQGICEPVVARFALSAERLVPAWIMVGSQVHRPGEPGWDDAKRIVNGLDARYCAFVRHLLNSHLMVGEAFALAATVLPVWHPLRPFMDFFTYGTLEVNHFAYEGLLSANSYFIRSSFLSFSDVQRLMTNATATFDFDEWNLPKDLAKRGLEEIPDHPYVADALTIWPPITRVVRRHLDDLGIDDATVAADPDLAGWYRRLREVLPASASIPELSGRDDLVDLLTALLYNNVIHEVCGNLAPLLGFQDPDDKLTVSFEHLRAIMTPGAPRPVPRAADVLLMDQAAYVSSFNVAGNNLLTIDAARFIDDPRLCRAVEELQESLKDLGAELVIRNASRGVPFHTMQPSRWEASISF